MKEVQEKTIEFAQSKSGLKALSLIFGVLLLIALLSFVAYQSSAAKDYSVLYTHLNPDDAGNVLSALQEENIPYKVEGGGSIIMAPSDKVYEIRLKLAAKGIPNTTVVGLELFEEPKMGTTQFQENVNFMRAIEGELVRTIRQIDAVKDAKVNIALPKESIFVREAEEPKASVIIRLWPGKDLNKEQIKATVFLVSHSVPKLKSENVTVVDNLGRVLSDVIEGPGEEEEGDQNVHIKKGLERQVEKNVQSMLAKALGAEKVVVRASVEIETGKIHQQDELYDPDKTAVVSERKIQENDQSTRTENAGVPGASTNVPPVINAAPREALGTQKNKKDTTTNYNVSKSLVDTKKPIFEIKKLSVGVLIDGKYRVTKDANGTESRTFVPRSDEELGSYEELIKSAIGFDADRGDKITVMSVPFEASAIEIEMGPSEYTTQDIALFAGIGILGLVLIAILGLVGAKALKGKKEEAPSIPIPEEAKRGLKAAHEREAETMILEREPAYNAILDIVDETPEHIASLIGKWLKEETA